MPIYKVSKILGRSSVVVTGQRYGHLSMAGLQEAVDEIDGAVTVNPEQIAVKLQSAVK